MKVLVIDIGGTNVKFLATGRRTARKFPSGPKLTPRRMVAGVKQLTADWKYDAVSIGYPGVIKRGRVVKEPQNLGPGWVGFDFKAAFGHPAALDPDDVVLGGGGAKHLKKPPKGCRVGNNAHALMGGIRLWDDADRKKKGM